jgi:hypothetical protein
MPMVTDFGSVPISTGDLVLIIQMQDAEINSTTTNYGSGIVNSFLDQKEELDLQISEIQGV